MTSAIYFLAIGLRVLSLEEAVSTAQARQPTIRQARALTRAAHARSDEARSYLLPQLNGTAQYQRTTSNFAPTPGFNLQGTNVMIPEPTFSTSNYYNFGLTLSQYIWDFGVTTDRFRAARALAEAQEGTEQETALQVVLGARTAYFAARAQKAMAQVSVENLSSQDKHLAQIEGYVKVGVRSQIDLAQAKSDHATARLQLINAENGYETAKAQLNQAMGLEAPTDYDVEDQSFGPVEGEDRTLHELVNEALRARPELSSFERQVRAQELTVSSVKGAYGPALGASMSLTDRGVDITNLGWNWNFSVNASWGLFQGLLTRSQVKEAEANLTSLRAQFDGLRQQVRLEVDQARLSARSFKQAIVAAGEARQNARVRLTLAEGRYQTGIGSIIELSDAQVAMVSAAAQKVQADYNLATARAQLAKALGRR